MIINPQYNLAENNIERIVSHIANTHNLGKSAREMYELVDSTIENIIPNTFEKNQKKELSDILAQYVFCTPYFQNWYNKYAKTHPSEKSYFDTQCVGDLRVRMAYVDLKDITIYQHAIILTLAKQFENKPEPTLSDSNKKEINNFLIENPLGHIIVVSTNNSRQNSAKIELAETYRLPFDYFNIHNIKPTYDVDDSFRLYAYEKIHSISKPTNEEASQYLENIKQLSIKTNIAKNVTYPKVPVLMLEFQNSNINTTGVSKIQKITYQR